MSRDGDKPAIGASRRSLGVVVPPQANPDLPVDDDGDVSPGTGGMSVVPDWRLLRYYRIPRRLVHIIPEASGKDTDACWRLGSLAFFDGIVGVRLQLRIGSPEHGTIEPVHVVSVERFQDDLAATCDQWIIDES